MTKPRYTVVERMLMQRGAAQAYERALAVVSLRGRARDVIACQYEHLEEHILAFDDQGDLHVVEAAA